MKKLQSIFLFHLCIAALFSYGNVTALNTSEYTVPHDGQTQVEHVLTGHLERVEQALLSAVPSKSDEHPNCRYFPEFEEEEEVKDERERSISKKTIGNGNGFSNVYSELANYYFRYIKEGLIRRTHSKELALQRPTKSLNTLFRVFII